MIPANIARAVLAMDAPNPLPLRLRLARLMAESILRRAVAAE